MTPDDLTAIRERGDIVRYDSKRNEIVELDLAHRAARYKVPIIVGRPVLDIATALANALREHDVNSVATGCSSDCWASQVRPLASVLATLLEETPE